MVNRYNPTLGFYGASSGIDPIQGTQLSTVQQWSSGLGAAGSTLLLGVGGLTGLSSTADTTIANPVPATVARVIPGEGPFPTLGLPGASDVFVTDPAAIQGMTPAQISQRLGIPPSDTYSVIQFPTPSSGLASPVFRSNPGFVGGGLTTGGAPEFVLPNGPVPTGATTTIIRAP